jgi:anti-anti-sigma factor
VARLVVHCEVDVSTASDLRGYIFQIIEAGYRTIQVDLRDCPWLGGSGGLAVLVEAMQYLESTGGNRLQILTGGYRHIVRVFDVTGTWQLFDFSEE